MITLKALGFIRRESERKVVIATKLEFRSVGLFSRVANFGARDQLMNLAPKLVVAELLAQSSQCVWPVF